MVIKSYFHNGRLYVSCEGYTQGTLYRYTLLCNEIEVITSDFIISNKNDFAIHCDGYYRVKVFSKKDNGLNRALKFSLPYFHCKESRIIEQIENKSDLRHANRVKVKKWTFDLLYFEGKIDNLFVMLTSAIDREKQVLPVFNRWSWAGEGRFPGHVICIADPTLERYGELTHGWYLGDKSDSLSEEIIQLINNIACVLGVLPSKIIFWGSSVGGFSALRLSQLISGSTAVAINSQTDINKYEIQRHVAAVKELCIDENSEINRTDAKCFVSDKSNIFLVQNTYDTHHYEMHYKNLVKYLDDNGIKHKRLEFSDKRGHVGETIKIVDEVIKGIQQMDQPQIDLQLDGNLLTATVHAASKSKECSYFFYLLNNGAVIQKNDQWQESNKKVWQLERDGVYAIQYHVKSNGVNRHYFSKPVSFIGCELRAEYEHELANINPAENINPLKYYSNTARGDSDWCVVSGVNCEITLDIPGFTEKKYHKNFRVFSNGTVIESDGYDFYFSGHVFHSGNLFYGANDIPSNDFHSINNNLGQYSLLKVNRNSGNSFIQNDFFGVRKSFYCIFGDFTFVSNRYHLLCLIISKLNFSLGLKLELDVDKILANLTFLSLQPFHQNINRNLDIKGLKVLPVDLNLNLIDGIPSFKDSRIVDSYEKTSDVSDDNYIKILESAKNEIIDSIRAISRNNNFKNIIVDLSGGLDSRLVYAAVTNVPEIRDRIKINSYYVKSEPADLEVALSLNQYYNYDYNDLSYIQCAPSNESYIFNDLESYNIGQYYSYTPIAVKNKISESIRLTGFYGEICARPYYSRKYRQQDEYQSLSTEDFVSTYIDRHSHLSIFGSSDEPLRLAKRLFTEEVILMPGTTAFDKFDAHYLYYRNGLHCSDYLSSDYSCPSVGPIMSESLFILKNTYTKIFNGIKVQLDLIKAINPLLSTHIYNASQDNEDYVKFSQVAPCPTVPNYALSFHLPSNIDKTEWLLACQKAQKGNSINTKHLDAISHFNEQYLYRDQMAMKLLKARLLHLISNGVFEKDSIGVDLWLNVKSEDATVGPYKSSFWYLYNKISSVFHQFNMINGL